VISSGGEVFADVSHYQSAVDLAAYADAGYTRIALKATEGTGYTDPTFAARWREAGGLGLHRVAYHFLRTLTSGGAQFDRLLTVVNAAGGLAPGDVLCADAEDVGYGGNDESRVARIARAAACTIEFTGRALVTGHPAGWIYTGRWYANPARITAAQHPAGWRHLWISDTTPAEVELPAGWVREQVVAVQYTDHANLTGIPGTDASFYLGDEVEDDMTPSEHAMLAQSHHLLENVLVPGQAKQAGQIAGLQEAVAHLSGGTVDMAAIESAAEKGAADALSHIHVVTDPVTP
jgi:GH25 family lysozyme M1 (1,4-beta-N-acetylmuramidase)